MATIRYEVEVVRRDAVEVVDAVVSGVDYNLNESQLAAQLVDKLESALAEERNFLRVGNTIVPLDFGDIPTFRVTIVSKSRD